MKKYILLSFCMVMFPLCAMQKASSSVALEGAFLPDVARQLDESTFGISQQPIQAGGCNCGSLSLQTSIKIAAAGLVGAGLGEGAYRLGFIKYEKTAVILGATIGVSAFACPEQRKKILDLALQLVTKAQ